MICLTTVVDKEYMPWLPAFVYCANMAYPEYRVKLFLRDTCPYNLNKWKLKCEIIPLFEDFPRYKYLTIALRFAIDKEHFEGFDCVYTTDIDIMIMRQIKTIESFHMLEMCETGLCYSNSTRNASHYEGKKSLSGLHFATREWYNKTNDLVAEYRKWLKLGVLGLYREYDGCMLYRIAERSGCGLPKKYKLTMRHHGIHCANSRLFDSSRLKMETRISSESRAQWLRHRGNRVFNEIIEETADENMKKEVSVIDKYCRGEL